MEVMSEQPKQEGEEPFEPVPDPRFANETPEERKARGQRALKIWQRIQERGGLQLDIDIDELRGRKRS
jgi:hypothetical protein